MSGQASDIFIHMRKRTISVQPLYIDKKRRGDILKILEI